MPRSIWLRAAFIAGAAALWLASASFAQSLGRAHIVPQHVAAQHGLYRQWVLQTQLDPKLGKVTDVTLEGAYLYVQNSLGMVQAIDAETGRTLWVVQVGRSDAPMVALAATTADPPKAAPKTAVLKGQKDANSKTTVDSKGKASTDDAAPAAPPAPPKSYVIVASGSMLYALDRDTGVEQWARKSGGSPQQGLAASGSRLFVAMQGGKVESYLIEDRKASPLEFKGHGRVETPLTIADDPSGKIVVWGTSIGNVYAAAHDSLGAMWKFHTGAPVVAPISVAGGMLYVASRDGFVYALDQSNGNLLWRTTVSDTMSRQPMAIDKSIYALMDSGGLVQMDLITGHRNWTVPGITELLAVSPSRVYALDQFGKLETLDIHTGGQQDSLDVGLAKNMLTNDRTDRIFLVTEQGVIQCLRPLDSERPLVHQRLVKAAKVVKGPELKKSDPAKAAAAGAAPKAAAKKDAAGDDAAPAEDGGDPFGAAKTKEPAAKPVPKAAAPKVVTPKATPKPVVPKVRKTTGKNAKKPGLN